jgi:hypothetical protein
LSVLKGVSGVLEGASTVLEGAPAVLKEASLVQATVSPVLGAGCCVLTGDLKVLEKLVAQSIFKTTLFVAPQGKILAGSYMRCSILNMSWILVVVFGVAAILLAIKLLKLNRRVKELEPFAAIVPESEKKANVILNEARVKAEAAVAEANRRSEVKAAEANSKYNEIVREANVAIQAAREATEREVSSLREEANNALRDAKLEASQKRQEAKDYSEKLKAKVDEAYSAAQAYYNRILTDAANRAKAIAGDAYDALRRANELQATIDAMKNTIEGYGDRYLVPTYSILDELAEKFGFTEAGEQLRQARENTRRMCKTGQAAQCDYVETNRRETAIRFVLDAFNGKVDSILAKTKHDNIGTLKQAIVDAFNIVNNGGAAFRNARINQAYLDARLEELKWGVVVQELREQAKDEQRRLKEQMREEAKARKEFERAMKEAAKEEDTVRKAMEKARVEIAKATDEQRAKYEAKLAELQIRLTQAEEKNKRALSMAQQTRRGNVYIISNIGSFGENVYKIGMTRRLDPEDRVKELGDASVPFEFDVHAMITHDDAPTLEHELHRLFLLKQVNKVNPRKEFFRVDLAAIKDAVEKMGIKGHWTLEAKAAQYRETRVLEREMQADAQKEREWLESQSKFEARELRAMDENEEELESA